MKTVHNERLKVSATFLNGIAIAILAIGGLSPAVQAVRTVALPAEEWTRTILIAVVCLFTAGIRHFAARAMLGGLKE